MSKLELWSQERMGTKLVPLPDKEGFRDFGEYVKSNSVPAEKKITLIWKIAHLETLNGVTKDELQSMLKWLVEHWAYLPEPPKEETNELD